MTTNETKQLQRVYDIEQLKSYNSMWFGQGNRRFFGDFSYNVYLSNHMVPYLVQGTYKWTDRNDMFGRPQQRQKYYRVIPINVDGKIALPRQTEEFSSLYLAKKFIRDKYDWHDMVYEASFLSDEDRRRHALVSTQNRHKCQECFCCACAYGNEVESA